MVTQSYASGSPISLNQRDQRNCSPDIAPAAAATSRVCILPKCSLDSVKFAHPDLILQSTLLCSLLE